MRAETRGRAVADAVAALQRRYGSAAVRRGSEPDGGDSTDGRAATNRPCPRPEGRAGAGPAVVRRLPGFTTTRLYSYTDLS